MRSTMRSTMMRMTIIKMVMTKINRIILPSLKITTTTLTKARRKTRKRMISTNTMRSTMMRMTIIKMILTKINRIILCSLEITTTTLTKTRRKTRRRMISTTIREASLMTIKITMTKTMTRVKVTQMTTMMIYFRSIITCTSIYKESGTEYFRSIYLIFCLTVTLLNSFLCAALELLF